LDAISIADANENIAERLPEKLLTQFERAGKAMAAEMPDASRKRAHYCLVGVIDAAGKVWFNSVGAPNYLHPDLYSKMLPTLFDIPAVFTRRELPIPTVSAAS
jgi:hypothetical protein